MTHHYANSGENRVDTSRRPPNRAHRRRSEPRATGHATDRTPEKVLPEPLDFHRSPKARRAPELGARRRASLFVSAHRKTRDVVDELRV